MKTGLLFLSLVVSFSSIAQKSPSKNSAPASFKLEKGQVINISTTSDMDMDMSMGMNMKNHSVASNTFKVTDVSEKTYTVTSVMNRMVFTATMMGQEMKFDSDNKDDMASETGAAIKDKIGVEATATIDRTTGKVTITNSSRAPVDTEVSPNPMASMMGGGEVNQEENFKSAFFIIPAGKKTGSTWQDSSAVDKMKTHTTYTLKSINNGVALIGFASVVSGTTQMESQGMDLAVQMTSNTTGDITLNTATSLVSNRTSKASIAGTVDVGGQSMDITSTATSETIFK